MWIATMASNDQKHDLWQKQKQIYVLFIISWVHKARLRNVDV